MKCPNCQSENIQQLAGGKLLCPGCNTAFKIETDGAKVVETDVLLKINQRLDQHEKTIEQLKGGKPAESAKPDDSSCPVKDEACTSDEPYEDEEDLESETNIFPE